MAVRTSIRGGATEVLLSRMKKPSEVAASLVQTLSWRERRVKKIKKATNTEFQETLLRLPPLIGASDLINSLLES